MTHDELLVRVNALDYLLGPEPSGDKAVYALRAVVELHKPDESDFPDEWENCIECSGNGYSALYPCETIKTIEKELR